MNGEGFAYVTNFSKWQGGATVEYALELMKRCRMPYLEVEGLYTIFMEIKGSEFPGEEFLLVRKKSDKRPAFITGRDARVETHDIYEPEVHKALISRRYTSARFEFDVLVTEDMMYVDRQLPNFTKWLQWVPNKFDEKEKEILEHCSYAMWWMEDPYPVLGALIDGSDVVFLGSKYHCSALEVKPLWIM